MTTDKSTSPATTPKAMLWTGYVISALVTLMMGASAIMKFLMKPTEDVLKSLDGIGWKIGQIPGLGVLELTCAVIYAIPQTSILGAILLTGYLGGAIATHVRVGDPFYVQAGIGVLVWLGVYLRDARLRAILPLRL